MLNSCNYVINMNRWVGRNAVVTGPGSGIGQQIVISVINVTGIDVDKDSLIKLSNKTKKFSGKLHAHFCDIRKVESIN